jgi:hypothetical protein
MGRKKYRCGKLVGSQAKGWKIFPLALLLGIKKGQPSKIDHYFRIWFVECPLSLTDIKTWKRK